MGLRTQTCGGKHQASECSAVVVPRCCPASPCKGHLCAKRNSFCVDSARHRSNQYTIKNHMVFHYNKILSSKAAVDSSEPKSRSSSIKLADQQRREKLRKKVPRCEEKVRPCEAVPGCCSRECGRLVPCSLKNSLLEEEDGLFCCAGLAQHRPRASCAHGDHCLVHCSPAKHLKKCSRNRHRTSYSNSSVCVSRPPCRHAALSRSHSTESFLSSACSPRCQGSNPNSSSGDLLEKHSACFTRSRKPFTPRTLVSDAKSFLSDYRYYTPPRRKKKNHHRHHVEAQTQTDIISFPCADNACEGEVMCEEEKIIEKAEDKICTSDEPEREIDDCQCSILRETSECPRKSSARKNVDSEEEELLYLTFIEDVTNEILRLGLFSNRVLDELFECHIEENKDRLDEGKMRQMLKVLKSDLGCCQDSETELTHAGQEALDPLDLQELDKIEEFECPSKGHRPRKATKNEEFLDTTDSSFKEPNKCESQSWSTRSRETQSREDFSEIMGAGTEYDFCDVEFEEHPDPSPSCEEDLNLIACHSDLGVNKDLDELEEDFAGALHLSHNYS